MSKSKMVVDRRAVEIASKAAAFASSDEGDRERVYTKR